MVIDNYFDLGLLMGAVLSFLLSIYLIFYPGKFYPNRILGVLVLSWSITVFVFNIQSPEFFVKYPHLYATADVFTLLFFPLMYLYLRAYLFRDEQINYRFFLHFVPAFLYLLLFSPFFLQSGEAKVEMFNTGFPEWFRPLQSLFNLVIIVQGVVYSVFSFRMLHRFQYFRKRRLNAYQIENLNWLRLFVISNVILWIIGTTGAFLDIFGVVIFVDLFKVFYLGLTLLTILLSVFTIQRPQLFSVEDGNKPLVTPKSISTSSEEQRYSKEDLEVLSKYLKEQKPYLKNDLKMQDLVEDTGISYKRISEVFNNHYNKSFYEVMNEYRVNEAKRLIGEDFHVKHTLPYLATEAGFNSKTTFNRIFKKFTGQTPSEYIKLRK